MKTQSFALSAVLTLAAGCALEPAVSASGALLSGSAEFIAVATASPAPACTADEDGHAYVSLDGAGSTGSAGRPLYFRWYDASGARVASGVNPWLLLPIGTHVFSLVVTDGVDASAPAEVVADVRQDVDPPEFFLPGDHVVRHECGEPFVDVHGILVYEECMSDAADMVQVDNNIDPLIPRRYKLTYRLTDRAGHVAESVRDVVVMDTQGPPVSVLSTPPLGSPDDAFVDLSLSDCAEVLADQCDGALEIDDAGRIVAIYSDEPDSVGPGDPGGDIQIVDHNSFRLRNQRADAGNGRVYGVEFVALDGAGNAEGVHTCYFTTTAPDGGPAIIDAPEHRVTPYDGCALADVDQLFAGDVESVDIRGDLLVVGSPREIPFEEGGGNRNRGIAYVYERIGGHWQRRGTFFETNITPPDSPPDYRYYGFGREVAIGDGFLAVSGLFSPTDEDYYHRFRVYEKVGASWQPAWLFESFNPFVSGLAPLAASRDTFVVGDASGFGDSNYFEPADGRVHVNRREAGDWIEGGHIQASDGVRATLNQQDSDRFGRSVALEHTTMVVGQRRDRAVYVLQHFDGGWHEVAKFISPLPRSVDDDFGYSVATSGGTIAIGAPGDDTLGADAGAVYLYTYDSALSRWRQDGVVHASDGAAGDEFGRDVAIDRDGRDRIAVSSASADSSIYVFERVDGLWREALKISEAEHVHLSAQVAISGDHVASGNTVMRLDCSAP